MDRRCRRLRMRFLGHERDEHGPPSWRSHGSACVHEQADHRHGMEIRSIGPAGERTAGVDRTNIQQHPTTLSHVLVDTCTGRSTTAAELSR